MEKIKPNPIRIKIDIKQSIIYIAFVFLFVIFAITLNKSGFLSIGNMMNILRQTSLIAIMAVGMSLVLGAGQIDLSIGSLIGVVSLVTTLTLRKYGITLAIITGLSFGIAAGAINGLIISRLKIPAFLETMGMMLFWSGLSRMMTNLKSIPITNKTYSLLFGEGTIGPVPIIFIWAILFVFIGHIVLTKTSLGRRVLASGSNPIGAIYSGVNVKNVITIVMITSSFLAAIAGILWAGRFGGGRYSLGEGAELSVIAATVLGGTSLYGGKSSVLGAAIGAIMIGMINNALILYGLNIYQQTMFRGLIIIIAVIATTEKEK